MRNYRKADSLAWAGHVATAENGSRWYAAAGCLLLVVALCFRYWHVFAHPAFYSEDAVLFSKYYGGVRSFDAIFEHILGQPYLVTISSFFSWLIALCDVRLQPFLYMVTGLVWGIAASGIFFFSGLIRSRVILVAGPLFIGMVAMNNVFYFATNIYVMYTGVVVLLGLLFFSIQQSLIGTIFLGFWLIALPWAGPYSVVVIPAVFPFALFLSRKTKGKYYILLLPVVSTIGYFSQVKENTANILNLKKWWIIQNFFDNFLDRVIFFDLFQSVSPLWWIAVILFLCISFYLLRDDKEFIVNALVLLVIAFASFSLFYLSNKLPVYLFPKPCHVVISLVFWSVFLLYVADRSLSLYGRGYGWKCFFVGLLAVIIVADGRRHPDPVRRNPIPDTQLFTRWVYRLERLHLEQDNRYVVMRQETFQRPYFHPHIRVGNHQVNAVRARRKELPPDVQNRYLVD